MLDKLREDMKAAMKAKEQIRLSAIRMVMSSIKTAQIEKGEDLAEGDILGIIQKAIKTRGESVEQYEKAGRTDLADKEKAEIAVLEGYLPQQMSEDDIRALVQKIIEEEGAQSKGDIGKVMRRIMAEHKGQVDGKLVNRIANELLS
ncbi:MAG: GatB/YqeY domain-containing protein [Planctomycetota bacterium]